jgi:hypothetical protein
MTTTRIVSAGIAFVCLFALANIPAAAEGKAYGKPLAGKDTIPISTLLAEPDKYAGQTVRVEGLVTGVCARRGCWMTLAPDKGAQDLRIKVDDDVIVFPIEAKGRRAIAEGQFTKIAMSLEETKAWRKHLAEERREEFDTSQVTEPMTYYQIQATGAVIL